MAKTLLEVVLIYEFVGYYSVMLPDGRIMFVDYTNQGDVLTKNHLVGAYIETDDIK